jgi:hypothetical protein
MDAHAINIFMVAGLRLGRSDKVTGAVPLDDGGRGVEDASAVPSPSQQSIIWTRHALILPHSRRLGSLSWEFTLVGSLESELIRNEPFGKYLLLPTGVGCDLLEFAEARNGRR